MKTKSFNDVLDIVETLSEEQRESLITIVKQRLIEEGIVNQIINIKNLSSRMP